MTPTPSFEPTATLLDILLKRAHVLDEELHLLRQLIHFQSTLSHPKYLQKLGSRYPLLNPCQVKSEANAEAESLTDRYPEPRPHLFESLLQVMHLQAQELQIIFDDLILVNERFHAQFTGEEVSKRSRREASDPLTSDLPAYAKALEEILANVNRAQTYFIQRSEETSPSSFAVPRAFKRENQRTIMLIENTHRSYRRAAEEFVRHVLGHKGSANAGETREPLQSALSYEHLWSSRVTIMSRHNIREFNLFDKKRGRSVSAPYGLIGGASALLELPRFIPNLAHESAHLMFATHRGGDEALHWDSFDPRVVSCCQRLRSNLERLLFRRVQYTHHFDHLADVHLHELLADVVAIFVAGPYFIHSLFFTVAPTDDAQACITPAVPFAARMALLIGFLDYYAERRLAQFGLEGITASGAAPGARGPLCRPRVLGGDHSQQFAWWKPKHYLRIIEFINDRARGEYGHYQQEYVRAVRACLLELADIIIDKLHNGESMDRGLFFSINDGSTNADQPSLFDRMSELVNLVHPRSSAMARHLLGAAEARCQPLRFTFACALGERPDAAPENHYAGLRAANDRDAELHRLIVHLLSYSIAEHTDTREEQWSDRGSGEQVTHTRDKPHELRLFYALHRARERYVADAHLVPNDAERVAPTEPSVMRLYKYTCHWNDVDPASDRRDRSFRPFRPFRYSVHSDSDESLNGELDKFVAFGDCDIVIMRSKCRNGIAEVLGSEARKYRAPVLHASSGLSDCEGELEVHTAFAQQRDFLNVDGGLAGTERLDEPGDSFLVLSQVRFARAEDRMGRQLALGGKSIPSVIDRFSALFWRMELDGARPRRLLLGNGWEDVAVVWAIDSALAFRDVVLKKLFATYFDGDDADFSIERMVTTVLVAENRLWRYAERIDNICGQNTEHVSAVTMLMRKALEMDQGRWSLDHHANQDVQMTPGARPERPGEVLGVDFRVDTSCTLVNRAHPLSLKVTKELERAAREALTPAQCELDIVSTTSSTDLVLHWKFHRDRSLTFAFYSMVTALSYLIRQGVILNSATRLVVPDPDTQIEAEAHGLDSDGVRGPEVTKGVRQPT